MNRLQPLGTGGDQRSRLLRHHLPLALASAVVLALFMGLPPFDANVYPHADTFSGVLPQERGEGGPMDHGEGRAGVMDHGGGRAGGMDHGGARGGGMDRGGGRPGAMDHGGAPAGAPDGAMGHQRAQTGPMDSGRGQRRSSLRQLSFATGYVALGLLALTLLIGPANLLLRRRNPVSSYLRRDVGTWTAIASVVHVIFGLQVHGGGRIRDFLSYFVAPDGSPWLNSFGLANWTGLAALVIVLGLLAISSDAALGKLRAGPWKWLQRLNYGLFALVILHAFFYGALLRATSPFTLLLGFSVIAVFTGQAVGIRLWRRRYSRPRETIQEVA